MSHANHRPAPSFGAGRSNAADFSVDHQIEVFPLAVVADLGWTALQVGALLSLACPELSGPTADPANARRNPTVRVTTTVAHSSA